MRTSDIHLYANGDYWQARWQDDAGKPRAKSLGNRAKVSKLEAKRLCRDLAEQHAIRPAARNVIAGTTLAAWLDDFRKLTPQYSEATRTLYEQVGALLTEHFTASRRLDRISRQDAGMFRAWLSDGSRKLTEATIRKHIRHCKVIFATAVRYEHIAANPFEAETGAAPRVDKTWRYVSADDLAKLLGACPDRHWRALFALCRLAGLRLGEAKRLTWADVDHDTRMLTVQHEGKATTKRRRRTVPIVPTLAAELIDAFDAADAGEERVAPISTSNNLYRHAEAIIKRAELEPWGKVFHTMRKNCESDWLAIYPVMDVCDWLGHAPNVASKHYHQTGKVIIEQVTGRQSQLSC